MQTLQAWICPPVDERKHLQELAPLDGRFFSSINLCPIQLLETLFSRCFCISGKENTAQQVEEQKVTQFIFYGLPDSFSSSADRPIN
jgi:hypothetical protein